MQKNSEATEQKAGPAHPSGKEAVEARERGTSMEDDASLAIRLRRGDHSAAEKLVDRYNERVYLFMRAMGHDRQISEDLTQETFMRAWCHIGQLRDGKALSGWLFRIAGNASRLHRRRGKGKGTTRLESTEAPSDGIDGLQRAGEREQFNYLKRAVERLPWKLRQAVVLHYMEQLTIAEAADAAGIRQGTLKSRLSRGLQALRSEVTQE